MFVAMIDGERVESFDVTAEAWRSLRNNVADGSATAILQCCKSRAVLKTSHLGTHFFAHRGKSDCPGALETEAHLDLKRALYDAVRGAGWQATIEHYDQGRPWQADVLAVKGSRRVAFEIQWSPQSMPRTAERQSRYRSFGVGACWLFQTMPRSAARRDVPAFQIVIESDRPAPSILLAGHQVTASVFVEALFSKACRFRDHLDLDTERPYELGLVPTDCPTCGSHIFFIAEPLPTLLSRCGLPLGHLPRQASKAKLAAAYSWWHPAVNKRLVAESTEVVQSIALPRPPQEIEYRVYPHGICPSCFHVVPRTDEPPSATLKVLVKARQRTPQPHWCFAPSGILCERAA